MAHATVGEHACILFLKGQGLRDTEKNQSTEVVEIRVVCWGVLCVD